MSAIASAQLDRAEINRANAQYSTGPRSEAGKRRSSLNALRHGLCARSAVLPSEDAAQYRAHLQQFLDEYQPATPTETQLVHQLADTAWRLNRIPLLESNLLAEAGGFSALPADPRPAIETLALLGLHGSRLSRQFEKTLNQLREIQAERRQLERRELQNAAALLEFHKHKGIPWQPSDHGFVFSKDQVERFAERAMRQNEARHIEYVRFGSGFFAAPPPSVAAAAHP